MALLHKENHVAGMKVKRLEKKLSQFLEQSCVQLESSLSSDLCRIMDKEEQHALKRHSTMLVLTCFLGATKGGCNQEQVRHEMAPCHDKMVSFSPSPIKQSL